MSNKVDVAVVIGRFQPYHNGHHALIQKASQLANKVIVVVGSAYAARSAKNPFTYDERVRMIKDSHDPVLHSRILFTGVSDFFYNETRWYDTVKIKVAALTNPSDEIIVVGHKRDESSYYTTRFQGWKFVEVGVLHDDVNATAIREAYIQYGVIDNVPKGTHDLLFQFFVDEKLRDVYEELSDEYQAIKQYKESWKDAPYPPVFVTTDAVVHKSGYILLVKRRNAPGAGLWALPGGFLGENETLLESAVRELVEETGIRILPSILTSAVRDSQVFDYPYRSLRGRTITHAFLFDLGEGLLPSVTGQDDAVEARWFTVPELFMMQDQMFEDHYSIIHYFVSKL